MKKHTTILIVFTLFLLLELGIRFYVVQYNGVENFFASPRPLHSSSYILTYPEMRIGWKLKKNLNGFYKGKRFITNEHGFRDGPWKIKKQSGVHRIAVLGRSYSMGTGLSQGENWTDLFEIELNKTRPTEVLNFSVEGYTLVQMEAVYHRIVQNFDPDLLIIPIFYEEIDRLVPIETSPPPKLYQKMTRVNGWLGHLYIPQVVNYLNWKWFKQYTLNDWANLSLKKKQKVASTKVNHVLLNLAVASKKNQHDIVMVNMPRLYVEQLERDQLGKKRFNALAQGFEHVHIINDNDPLYKNFDQLDTVIIGDPHPNAVMNQRISSHIYKNLFNLKLKNN